MDTGQHVRHKRPGVVNLLIVPVGFVENTAVADALVSAPAAVALADDFMQVGSTFKQESCPRRRELRGNTHTKWILAHAGAHRVSGE